VKKLDFNNIVAGTTFHSNFFTWKSRKSFRATFRTNRTRTYGLHQIV